MFNGWNALVEQHSWIVPIGEIVALVAGAWLLRVVVIAQFRRWAARTETTLDDAIADLLERAIKPLLILAVSLAALNVFLLPEKLLKVLNRGLSLAILAVALYYVSKLLQLFLDAWLSRSSVRAIRDPVRFVVRALFAGLALMMVMDNLGISLTALWTTLGVGSVAVALALQDTLSNFFAGVYVRIDNPVRVGDYIKLQSGEEGFIVQLGWRSTRIRTLPNNIVVVPNGKLASSIITNYSLPEPQMSLLIPISVMQENDPAQVEEILIEEASRAANEVEGLLAQPAPFVRFGFADSSLNFTLICRVATFVDQYLVEHELRKRILTRFRAEGIVNPPLKRDLHPYEFKATGHKAKAGTA